MIRVPVSMEFVIAGKKVTVDAVTASVNDHGAMLSCSRPVATDIALEITNERTREKLACRITRSAVEGPDGYLIPVEFMAPCPELLAHLAFPPTNWKPLED